MLITCRRMKRRKIHATVTGARIILRSIASTPKSYLMAMRIGVHKDTMMKL